MVVGVLRDAVRIVIGICGDVIQTESKPGLSVMPNSPTVMILMFPVARGFVVPVTPVVLFQVIPFPVVILIRVLLGLVVEVTVFIQ